MRLPTSNGPLFMVTKPKNKFRFRSAAMLMFYILQEKQPLNGLHIFSKINYKISGLYIKERWCCSHPIISHSRHIGISADRKLRSTKE
jgi:hypothetical protein